MKKVKSLGTRTGIVKERVGVDTLFWRRYFVTYGAPVYIISCSVVQCRSPHKIYILWLFPLSSNTVFLHKIMHKMVQ